MARVHKKFRSLVTDGAPADAIAAEHEHHHEGPHVVPVWLLAAVLAILLVLTVVTVLVTYVDLGPANIFVALGIAVVKTAFVVLYFMHLRWDSPFNSVVMLAALLFIAIFLSFVMIDSAQYRTFVDEAVKVLPK